MMSFLIRKPALPTGTLVNRGLGLYAPARWDGVVVADCGDEVLVEWPKLGLVRERRHQLTAVDFVEAVARDTNAKPRRVLTLSPAAA
jgi:hypothetical protein